ISSSNIQWSKDNWKNIIEADGKGYYAYLPAIFIYHDLNFSFFDRVEKLHPNPAIYYDYRINYNGKTADKYFAGSALAMSPFFIVQCGNRRCRMCILLHSSICSSGIFISISKILKGGNFLR